MLNPYFNNFNDKATQALHQSLIVNAIKTLGHEIYYIPRNIVNYHKIYDADDQSTYTNAIPTEVYIEDYGGQGFVGQDLFSKFGLNISDSMTFAMASETFARAVGPQTTEGRPMEGDLIFFTLNQKCFQIMFTNDKEMFYPFGALPMYKMTCELFQYSDETFSTGIPEIDILQQTKSLNILDNTLDSDGGLVLTDESGNIITTEDYDTQNIDPVADNDAFGIEGNTFIDFSTNNPFGNIQP